MKYRVMVVSYGYADIEANNAEEALKAVDSMGCREFVWDTNWSSRDAVIVEELDKD